MGLRIRKTIRLGRFTRINLSRRVVGWSVGVPGSGVSYGSDRGGCLAGGGGGCLGLFLLGLFACCCVVGPCGRRPPGHLPGEQWDADPALANRRGYQPGVDPASLTPRTPTGPSFPVPQAPQGEVRFYRPTAALLARPPLDGVWMAASVEDRQPLMDALARFDRGGPGAGDDLASLHEKGRAGFYPAGTPVNEVDETPAWVRVEVFSGDFAGEKGWVLKKYVRDLP